MAPWFTPRRCLAYSAYFVGVFSLCIGLFISKHVWNIHTTIRLIEKSWDLRGHDHRNSSWLDKASHAVFAGHEDMSEYNDLFWAKFGELAVDNGQGSFNRSNLTTCKPGYAPEWVDANAGYEKWGFVLYRTHYDEDDEVWAQTVRYLNWTIRSHLEIEATIDGSECDPELVRDRAVLEIIEDRETLEDATPEKVRTLWRERVDSRLVDDSFMTGGWNSGWFRLRLRCERGSDGEYDSTTCKKANGMALNLCLMYDTSTRIMIDLAMNGHPSTGPRDPWEPYLLAIDGMWSTDKYMYRTSWAHEYRGWYGVALSVLFNNFHGRTFEREMERQAPYMEMGLHNLNDDHTPRWQQLLFALFVDSSAVARPGRFPFHDRWQETQYPFVREDSYWKDPAKPENTQTDVSAASPQKPKAFNYKSMLEDSTPKVWLPCVGAEKNAEGCFQMGNLRVREAGPSKKRQRKEVGETKNDVKQDVTVEEGLS